MTPLPASDTGADPAGGVKWHVARLPANPNAYELSFALSDSRVRDRKGGQGSFSKLVQSCVVKDLIVHISTPG